MGWMRVRVVFGHTTSRPVCFTLNIVQVLEERKTGHLFHALADRVSKRIGGTPLNVEKMREGYLNAFPDAPGQCSCDHNDVWQLPVAATLNRQEIELALCQDFLHSQAPCKPLDPPEGKDDNPPSTDESEEEDDADEVPLDALALASVQACDNRRKEKRRREKKAGQECITRDLRRRRSQRLQNL